MFAEYVIYSHWIKVLKCISNVVKNFFTTKKAKGSIVSSDIVRAIDVGGPRDDRYLMACQIIKPYRFMNCLLIIIIKMFLYSIISSQALCIHQHVIIFYLTMHLRCAGMSPPSSFLTLSYLSFSRPMSSILI